MRLISILSASIGLILGSAAFSAETVSYTYDARGRVKTVIRTGTVNNNVQTTYSYDKANNRKTKVTTGSSNSPPPP